MNSKYHNQTSRDGVKMILPALLTEAPTALKGRTYVQKLTFLLQQEADTSGFVFEPYDYGPFSRELYDTLDNLIENGYVIERETKDEDGLIHYTYETGPKTKEELNPDDYNDLKEAAQTVFDEYPTDDLQELIHRIYPEHPQMARNSIY